MQNITRTLRVYGHSDQAQGRVLINNECIHDRQFDSGLLYEFSTSVMLHGSVGVDIEIVSGCICIEKITCSYPAVINGSTLGWYTFDVPIQHPYVDLNKNFLKFPLPVDKELHCRHIMFNGPKTIMVLLDPRRELTPGMEITSNQAVAIHADWGYNYINWNPDSKDDVNRLINW